MNRKHILGILLLFGIDQGLKYGISYALHETKLVLIPNFLTIDMAYNRGGAFSIFSGHLWFLILLTIASLFLLKYLLNEVKQGIWKDVMIAFLYGGILGNLFDRLCFGYVRDFIDVTFGSYHYPTFNFADIFIVVGIGLLIFSYFRKGEQDANRRQ